MEVLVWQLFSPLCLLTAYRNTKLKTLFLVGWVCLPERLCSELRGWPVHRTTEGWRHWKHVDRRGGVSGMPGAFIIISPTTFLKPFYNMGGVRQKVVLNGKKCHQKILKIKLQKQIFTQINVFKPSHLQSMDYKK